MFSATTTGSEELPKDNSRGQLVRRAALILGLALAMGCGSDESLTLVSADGDEPSADSDAQQASSHADDGTSADDHAATDDETNGNTGGDSGASAEPFDYASVERPWPSLDVDEILDMRGELPVEWEACAALTERGEDDPALEPLTEAELELSAECTSSSAPLFYHEPDIGRFNAFVKRLATGRANGDQLWLLNGGPGFSGRSLEDFALLVLERVPELTVYIPDHRGTGRSAVFECIDTFGDGADVVTELEDCGDELVEDYGDLVDAFRTTEAAMDVVDLIARTATAGDRVTLHGGSYGGYWLHRVLQLAPELVDAVVFESSVKALGRVDALEVGNAPIEAGRRLLELCAEHDACRERLGDAPYERARTILGGFETECPGLVDAGWSRLLLQSVATIALDYPIYRDLLPAMLHRLERCEAADREWVEGYLAFVLSGEGLEILPPTREAPSSRALFFHITLSELIARQLPRETLQEATLDEVFTSAFRNLPLNGALETWPVYPKDAYWGELARTDAPVLVLHGELDPRTPPSEGAALADQFSGPEQHFVLVPGAGHGVVQSSRMTDSDSTCGLEILSSFLSDPSGELDDDCATLEVVPDFSAGEAWVEVFAPGQGVWD